MFCRSNESLIPRGRNYLLMEAMSNAENFTHIIYIDADIEFSPEAVERMILRDEPMMCAIYPKKKLLTEKIVRLARDNPDMSHDEIMAQAVGYVVTFETNGTVEVDDFWVEVEECGTGFMMMQRGTVEAMQKAYAHLRNRSNESIGGDVPKDTLATHLYHLFDTQIDPVSHRYLSEDYVFLKRWRQMGGRVFADLSSKLSHYGASQFTGWPFRGIVDVQNGKIRDDYQGVTE